MLCGKGQHGYTILHMGCVRRKGRRGLSELTQQATIKPEIKTQGAKYRASVRSPQCHSALKAGGAES